MLAIESERSGQVRNSSVGKRLQIVSTHRQDSLEFPKSIGRVFVDHGISFKVGDFVEVVCDSEIECSVDKEVVNLKNKSNAFTVFLRNLGSKIAIRTKIVSFARKRKENRKIAKKILSAYYIDILYRLIFGR